MFAGTAARHLACKPVAPADASIYHDALGFTAKKSDQHSTFNQPTKSEGTGYSLRKEGRKNPKLS